MSPLTSQQEDQLRGHLKAALAILDGAAAQEKAASSSEWRKEFPTEKQIKILKEQGYAIDGLTRGQASEIIDRIFKKARR